MNSLFDLFKWKPDKVEFFYPGGRKHFTVDANNSTLNIVYGLRRIVLVTFKSGPKDFIAEVCHKAEIERLFGIFKRRKEFIDVEVFVNDYIVDKFKIEIKGEFTITDVLLNYCIKNGKDWQDFKIQLFSRKERYEFSRFSKIPDEFRDKYY
jgi:hypothetical protein